MIWQKARRTLKMLFAGNMIIAWMMLAALIPMLLVVYVTYNLSKTTLYRTIDRDITLSMKKKVIRFDNYISERKLDLVQLTKLPNFLDLFNRAPTDPLRMHSELMLRNYLKYLEKKIGISDVFLLDLDGKIVFTLNKNMYKEGDVVSDPKWQRFALYRAFFGAKIIQIPFVSTNFSEGKNNIYLAGIISEERKMKGVLATKLSLDAIQKMVDQWVGFAKSEGTFISTLVDNKPKVVLSSSNEADVSLNPIAMDLLNYGLRGGTGRPLWETEKGSSFILASDYIPQLNMGMLIRYDETEIHDLVNWYRVRILLLISISVLIVLFLVYLVSNSLRRVVRKNEDLLASILPSFVIEELNEKKRFAARNIDHVSIVFMDIVNFTSFSASRSPELVVKALDNLFLILDALCDKYQLEKIKTMGDAHMSASGLIHYQADHANRALDMALEAILAIKHYNLDYGSEFSLRVGIDSGKITAGIVGRRKPSYDIWGHTVNRASRMESTGFVNQVQITESTYEALNDKEAYTITSRTGVAVKGLGEMNTYLVSDSSKNLQGKEEEKE